MEQLGAMEPDQLLQLLLGVIGCAVVMLVLTVAYIVLARRSNRARSRSEGTSVPTRADAVGTTIPAPGAATLAHLTSRASGRPTALDIRARLAGTGRYAPSRREILRVGQDPRSAGVWVEVTGVRYSELSQVHDRAMGERVLSAVTCALRFSNGLVASDEGVTHIHLPGSDEVVTPAGFGPLSAEDEPGEVMRLVADGVRRELCIQVGGHCYRALSDVVDNVVLQRILTGVSYLLQFSHGRLVANDGVRVVPVPALTARPLPERPQPAVPGERPPKVTTAGEEGVFLRQVGDQSPTPVSGGMARPSRGGRMRGLGAARQETAPSLSLADQIDGILQRKLESSSLAHVDAQIVAYPDGSVRIRVGTKYYERPDDLPEGPLRKIIEAAIAEW